MLKKLKGQTPFYRPCKAVTVLHNRYWWYCFGYSSTQAFTFCETTKTLLEIVKQDRQGGWSITMTFWISEYFDICLVVVFPVSKYYLREDPIFKTPELFRISYFLFFIRDTICNMWPLFDGDILKIIEYMAF